MHNIDAVESGAPQHDSEPRPSDPGGPATYPGAAAGNPQASMPPSGGMPASPPVMAPPPPPQVATAVPAHGASAPPMARSNTFDVEVSTNLGNLSFTAKTTDVVQDKIKNHAEFTGPDDHVSICLTNNIVLGDRATLGALMQADQRAIDFMDPSRRLKIRIQAHITKPKQLALPAEGNPADIPLLIDGREIGRPAGKYSPGAVIDNGYGMLYAVAIDPNVSSERVWMRKDLYDQNMNRKIERRNNRFLRGKGNNKRIVFTNRKTKTRPLA